MSSRWSLEGVTNIGLVTIEPIEVLHYGGIRPLGDSVSKTSRDRFPQSNEKKTGMRKVYRVSHSAAPHEQYFLEAGSPEEAIEIVTLRLADLEGMKAWRAEPGAPAFEIPHGAVVDHEGTPVMSMEG